MKNKENVKLMIEAVKQVQAGGKDVEKGYEHIIVEFNPLLQQLSNKYFFKGMDRDDIYQHLVEQLMICIPKFEINNRGFFENRSIYGFVKKSLLNACKDRIKYDKYGKRNASEVSLSLCNDDEELDGYLDIADESIDVRERLKDSDDKDRVRQAVTYLGTLCKRRKMGRILAEMEKDINNKQFSKEDISKKYSIKSVKIKELLFLLELEGHDVNIVKKRIKHLFEN